MEELTDKRLQKLVNEAYWVFTQLYGIKYPDIFYNGGNIEYDEDGHAHICEDTFGHYIIVNDHDYYAVNIDDSIEKFGFCNYKDAYPEAAVEVIKFKGNLFANNQVRYCVDFQVNPVNGEFIEAFEVFANYSSGRLFSPDRNLLDIKPQNIDMGAFEYLCEGFHRESYDDLYDE